MRLSFFDDFGRCEAVRHCRWVDEVTQEAPWVIGADFIEKYQIDYVAHDEEPYASVGHDDVYWYAKSQGSTILLSSILFVYLIACLL